MPEQPPADDHPLHALSDTMRAFAEATADYDRLVAAVADLCAAIERHAAPPKVRTP